MSDGDNARVQVSILYRLLWPHGHPSCSRKTSAPIRGLSKVIRTSRLVCIAYALLPITLADVHHEASPRSNESRTWLLAAHLDTCIPPMIAVLELEILVVVVTLETDEREERASMVKAVKVTRLISADTRCGGLCLIRNGNGNTITNNLGRPIKAAGVMPLFYFSLQSPPWIRIIHTFRLSYSQTIPPP
jgi:hypothetical protein